MTAQHPELHFLWMEVSNLANAVDFYRSTLGFPVQDDAGTFAIVHLANTRLYLAPGMPRGYGMQIAVAVTELDALIARMHQHGLAMPAATDEGWARYINVADPDGYRFIFLQLTPPVHP